MMHKTHDITCESTMKLLGDYWTLRIIDSLTSNELRFCELQRSLDNVNPVTLTKRLKTLEDARIISRTEETRDKISVTYCLTELGEEVLPIIKALDRFSAKAQTT
jgi:DNA-binding HxlR family transcriptional regulator